MYLKSFGTIKAGYEMTNYNQMIYRRRYLSVKIYLQNKFGHSNWSFRFCAQPVTYTVVHGEPNLHYLLYSTINVKKWRSERDDINATKLRASPLRMCYRVGWETTKYQLKERNALIIHLVSVVRTGGSIQVVRLLWFGHPMRGITGIGLWHH